MGQPRRCLPQLRPVRWSAPRRRSWSRQVPPHNPQAKRPQRSAGSDTCPQRSPPDTPLRVLSYDRSPNDFAGSMTCGELVRMPSAVRVAVSASAAQRSSSTRPMRRVSATMSRRSIAASIRCGRPSRRSARTTRCRGRVHRAGARVPARGRGAAGGVAGGVRPGDCAMSKAFAPLRRIPGTRIAAGRMQAGLGSCRTGATPTALTRKEVARIEECPAFPTSGAQRRSRILTRRLGLAARTRGTATLPGRQVRWSTVPRRSRPTRSGGRSATRRR